MNNGNYILRITFTRTMATHRPYCSFIKFPFDRVIQQSRQLQNFAIDNLFQQPIVHTVNKDSISTQSLLHGVQGFENFSITAYVQRLDHICDLFALMLTFIRSTGFDSVIIIIFMGTLWECCVLCLNRFLCEAYMRLLLQSLFLQQLR